MVAKARTEKVSGWKKRCRLPHFIYGLYDPRDNALRYIGCSHDIEKRLTSHLHHPLNCLRGWFSELKSAGLSPVIKAIETADGAIDGHWRERELIRQHAATLGDQLLNVCSRADYEAEAQKRCEARDLKRREIAERRTMREAMRKILSPKRPARPPRIIEHDGLRLNLTQWAKRIGLSRERVRQRVNKYPPEIALKPGCSS